jgi:hypothetical protein
MYIEGTGFYTFKECHKTESLLNRTATAHKERERLGDRRMLELWRRNGPNGPTLDVYDDYDSQFKFLGIISYRLKAATLLTKHRLENIAEIKIIPVTESEIIGTIKSLKSKNTAGHDGISSKILKHCAHVISKPLTYICNMSLITGTFPDRC